MTLIAQCRINDLPFYFGDLLLSREGETREPINIPVANNINALLPAGTPRSVSGMRQKLNILSDRLIVAWAGSYLQARSMIRQFKELDNEGNLSIENINKIIDEVDIADKNNLSLIGTIVTPLNNGQGGVHLQHFEFCTTTHEISNTTCVVAGSGEKTFVNIATSLVQTMSKTNNDFNLFEMAENFSTLLISQFAGHEILTGENITEWWGGGFEVAGLRNARFEKLSNILFTFWRAIPDHENKQIIVRFVPKIIKYDYIGDALVIQKFEGKLNAGDNTFVLLGHESRVYVPLLKGRKDYDFKTFPSLGFDHTTLCCYLLGPSQDGKADCGSRIYVDSSGQTPFRLALTADGGELQFQQRLLDDMKCDVEAVFGLPAVFRS